MLDNTIHIRVPAVEHDPTYSDPVLGAAGPTLDKLVGLGKNGTAANNAYFDDFYLSTSGYNATVPRPYGNSGRQPATLSIDWVGTQLRIQFGSGTLQQSTDLTNWRMSAETQPRRIF